MGLRSSSTEIGCASERWNASAALSRRLNPPLRFGKVLRRRSAGNPTSMRVCGLLLPANRHHEVGTYGKQPCSVGEVFEHQWETARTHLGVSRSIVMATSRNYGKSPMSGSSAEWSVAQSSSAAERQHPRSSSQLQVLPTTSARGNWSAHRVCLSLFEAGRDLARGNRQCTNSPRRNHPTSTSPASASCPSDSHSISRKAFICASEPQRFRKSSMRHRTRRD